MAGTIQRNAAARRPAVRRNSAAPFLVCASFVVAALGVAYLALSGDRSSSNPGEQQLAQSSAPESAPVANSLQPLKSATPDSAQSPAQPANETAAPAAAPVQSVDAVAMIESQLDAGEFGPALVTAQSVSDVEQRTRLLKMVANAQLEAGEFKAVQNTIRRMPNPGQRVEASGARTGLQTLAGGGVNIDELIELIQNNTGQPDSQSWDSGGGIGTIDTWNPGGLSDGGIRVDPKGLLYRLARVEKGGRLAAVGAQARHADLNDDMARSSDLRLVSLTRLQREVERRLAEGRPVVASMKHLAGLSQIRYVFVFPEEKEIVIGGPAEGWQYNDNGIPVGMNSGRPTLQLDDFVTVLRTFSAGGAGIFRCSINPREEGLKQLKEFVAQSNSRGSIRAEAVSGWVRQLEKKLGLQDIEIEGIPTDSRVARVIAEADFRMKLIGLDKLDNSVGIRSFFDLLTNNPQANAPDLDALRWWLTMKYDAVMHSPSRDVFEVQGSSVLCQSENELITSMGKRVPTGQSEPVNRMFAQGFTEKYADLAQHDLIFGDLQNIFDLSLVAALIRHERLDERAGFELGAFATDGMYRTATYEPPKTATTVANYRMYRGRDIVVQVAGGVRGDLMSIVKNTEVYRQADRLENVSQKGRPPELPAGRWWWDATP